MELCRKKLLLLKKVKVLQVERTNLMKEKVIYCSETSSPEKGHESFWTQCVSSPWGTADQKKQAGMMDKYVMRHAHRKFPIEEQTEQTINHF